MFSHPPYCYGARTSGRSPWVAPGGGDPSDPRFRLVLIAEIVGQFKDRFKLTVGYGVDEVKYTTFAYRGDIVSYNQYYLGVDNAKDAFVSLSN